MEDQFSRKHLALVSFLGFTVVVFQFVYSLTHARDIFVMCDVGQGDGMYIRIDKVDIVIDAGRGNLMAKCLSRYMSFFDKSIDLVFITNSDVDHFGGVRYLSSHYKIKKILIPAIADKDLLYVRLLDRLRRKKVDIDFIYKGDNISIGEKASFNILWPTREYIYLDSTDCGNKNWPQIPALIISCSNVNPFSAVFMFEYSKKLAVLFTGDIDTESLKNYINEDLKNYVRDNDLPIVIKIPHHGSRTGLVEETMQIIRPSLSLISAGRNNRYGHPHEQVLKLLSKYKSKYLLTSKVGDIKIELGNMTVRSALGGFIDF